MSHPFDVMIRYVKRWKFHKFHKSKLLFYTSFNYRICLTIHEANGNLLSSTGHVLPHTQLIVQTYLIYKNRNSFNILIQPTKTFKKIFN